MNRQLILRLCLFVATVQQVVASDHQSRGQLRDVAAVIDGGPLKPLSFIEKSITKDVDLLAKEIGNQLMPINSREDIYLCIENADRVIEKYIAMFSSGRVTKKRIDERNSIERAAALLRALPSASESCNLISYLDLMAILKAAAGDLGLMQPTDQVRSSILAAIKLHRNHCSGSYHKRLLSALNEMDIAARESVVKILDLDLIERIFPGYSHEPMVLFEAKNTHETLMRISNDLLDKVVITMDLADKDVIFTEILSRRLLEPCELFLQPLEGILLPAKVDMALRDMTNISLIDPKLNNRELIDTWARFHICSSIHYNELAIVNALRSEFSRKIMNV